MAPAEFGFTEFIKSRHHVQDALSKQDATEFGGDCWPSVSQAGCSLVQVMEAEKGP